MKETFLNRIAKELSRVLHKANEADRNLWRVTGYGRHKRKRYNVRRANYWATVHHKWTLRAIELQKRHFAAIDAEVKP